jgi:hypothetical protein
LERSRQPPTKAGPRASELTSAEATPAPALLLADPQDVKDPDQLRILVEVEAQDAAARPEHDLTEPRVSSWRPHHRIPGLSGQLRGAFNERITCVLGQRVELKLGAAAKLDPVTRRTAASRSSYPGLEYATARSRHRRSNSCN